MKVKQEILDLVNNVAIRMRIATILGLSEQAVYYAMRSNTPDGRMTKMDFLKAINQETGIDLLQILEETKEPA